MIYEFETGDPIEIKQKLYFREFLPRYYPHYLLMSPVDCRRLIETGIMEVALSFTSDAHYVLSAEGKTWLDTQGFEYYQRPEKWPGLVTHPYRLELSTREAAMLVKLAWG